MSLPGIIKVEPAPSEDGEACHCLCPVRHRTGICQGYVGADAVRIHYASAWSPQGVLSCSACWNDLPENIDEVPNIWEVPDEVPQEWAGPAPGNLDDGDVDG